MKKIMILSFLTAFLFITSCNNRTHYFNEYTWLIRDMDFNEETGEIKFWDRVFIKNDSSFVFSKPLNKLVGMPIAYDDSLLYITTKLEIEEGKLKKDTVIFDTLRYDFKFMFGKPMLMLVHTRSEYGFFAKCNEKITKFKETKNICDSITYFKVGGLLPGDSVNLKDFTDFEDNDYVNEKIFINAKLKDNINVNVKLINKSRVYSVEQVRIDESSVSNIVDLITRKVKFSPDTIYSRPPFYEEGFRWSNFQHEITLSKQSRSRYYLDQIKKEYNDFMIGVLRNMALESIAEDDLWTLSVENKIIQEALNILSNTNEVVSSVIE